MKFNKYFYFQKPCTFFPKVTFLRVFLCIAGNFIKALIYTKSDNAIAIYSVLRHSVNLDKVSITTKI